MAIVVTNLTLKVSHLRQFRAYSWGQLTPGSKPGISEMRQIQTRVDVPMPRPSDQISHNIRAIWGLLRTKASNFTTQGYYVVAVVFKSFTRVSHLTNGL